MQTLIIQNQTNSSLSYLSGALTVSASGSTTVGITQIFQASVDSKLMQDCLNSTVTLSDGNNLYNTLDAIDYLKTIASSLAGTVVGYIGAPAPSFAILVGSKDNNGNIQAASIDAQGGIILAGEGTAGTPTGGILTVQGASGGTELPAKDIINSSLSSGSITVSTSAVAARVGGSNLSGRKLLIITPITGVVYLGASNAVTPSTGIPIFPNTAASFSFSSNVTPYLIAAGSTTVNIMEGA